MVYFRVLNQMCYNYSLLMTWKQGPNWDYSTLDDILGLESSEIEKLKDSFQDRFYVNSYTLPNMPVITNEQPDTIQMYTWGLIPFWTKNQEEADKIRTKTMNARAETLFDKPSFRYAIRKKRCIIPASGFYEWRYLLGRNYPYYIHLKNRPIFYFAGIWESWHSQDSDETVYTYSIITCEPNNLLRKIHNKKKRMPVILPLKNQRDWINDDLSDDEIKEFMVAYPDDEMNAYTISKRITSKTQERNVKEVIEPFNYPEIEEIE